MVRPAHALQVSCCLLTEYCIVSDGRKTLQQLTSQQLCIAGYVWLQLQHMVVSDAREMLQQLTSQQLCIAGYVGLHLQHVGSCEVAQAPNAAEDLIKDDRNAAGSAVLHHGPLKGGINHDHSTSTLQQHCSTADAYNHIA